MRVARRALSLCTFTRQIVVVFCSNCQNVQLQYILHPLQKNNNSFQVFIWGGGKTSPQALTLFKKDRGAVNVCVAPKHFCVVTVEKELYTWSSGERGSCTFGLPVREGGSGEELGEGGTVG